MAIGTRTRPGSRRSPRSEERRAGAGASTTSAESRPAPRRRIRRPWELLVRPRRALPDIIGLQDLDALYGDPLSGRTLAIANETQGNWVVGIATEGVQSRAYRLNLSTGAIDDIGWAGSSFGYSVNSAGDAVGWGYFDAGETIQAAWILSERTGFARLNDLIDPASGWDLRTAASIDDFGGVVGWGYHNGRVSAYRLRVPAALVRDGRPMVAEKHTYGFDGLRTSTTTAPGTGSASVQFWFTQDYTQRNGVREHYLRLGGRLIARVTTQPNPNGMGSLAAAPDRAARSTQPVLAFVFMLAALAGIALGVAKRRRRWIPGLAGLASLLLGAASCEMLGLDRSAGALDWTVATNLTHFFHQGIAPGPNLITNSTGALEEERRYEPFGQPIPTVNVAAEPQNGLGKLTDPNTGWSYQARAGCSHRPRGGLRPTRRSRGRIEADVVPVDAESLRVRRAEPCAPMGSGRGGKPSRHERASRHGGPLLPRPKVVLVDHARAERAGLDGDRKGDEEKGLLEPRDRSIDKFTMSDGIAVAIEWAEREYLINMGVGYVAARSTRGAWSAIGSPRRGASRSSMSGRGSSSSS